VRREFLSGLRALVCLDGNPSLEERVRQGLQGRWSSGRYGVPFLGDNQFLLDRLEELSAPRPAHWFERLTECSERPRPRTTRLTIWIDRTDLSRTVSALYAPTVAPSMAIPDTAWTEVPQIEPT